MVAGTDLFPIGIATRAAHCNRTEERADLSRNIAGGMHTWLRGHRRTGKTSLIEQVLQDLAQTEIAATTVDLLVAHDAEDLEGRLRTAVAGVSDTCRRRCSGMRSGHSTACAARLLKITTFSATRFAARTTCREEHAI